MSRLFLVIGIIGVIACGFSAMFHILDMNLTGAMAWLFGVFINSLMVAFSYAEIKEGKL